MGDYVVLENEDVYYDIANAVETSTDFIKAAGNATQQLINETDTRIKDYFDEYFDAIRSARAALSQDINDVPDVSSWLTKTTDNYVATKNSTSNMAGGISGTYGGSGSSNGSGSSITTDSTKDVGSLRIDPTAIQALPDSVVNQMVSELKAAGYTQDEIDGILGGTVSINKTTTERLKSVFEEAVAKNPEVARIVEEATGFSIIDSKGNVDVNRLAVAELIAEKNLGMKIDLTAGSPFKKHINELSEDLANIDKTNPDIRQAIVDVYGMDVFNSDGTIDQNKLALIRVIDGQDLNDKYDIVKLIDKYKSSLQTNTIDQPGATDINPNQTQPGVDPGSIGSPSSGDVNPGTTGDGPAITTAPPATITPIGPGATGGETGSDINEKGVLGGLGNVLGADGNGIASVVSSSLENVGEGIHDVIDKGASTIASFSPYKGINGSSSGVNGNKAAAGIIAAASVAAGGAAAGGGVLLHSKMKDLRFTQDDWNSLGEDYQGIIENLMKKVGFSEDELETFKSGKFKLPTEELKEHIKKIEKAIDANPSIEDELLKLYNYSFFDDNKKVIEYLLFITMIIDGKNSIDEYNMYNVINQGIENVEEADYIYSGISMEDYFDETLSEEDVEVKILNDPTEEKEEKVEKESNEAEGELEEVNPSIDKEWLKGIGIDE